MIEVVKGNLLRANEDLIGHIVNCQGKMGSGLGIKIRLYYPKAFYEYEILCQKAQKKKKDLLGYVQCVPISENQSLLNIFGQRYYGESEINTEYEALKTAFTFIKKTYPGKSLALPYRMGCGLGGGNWEDVFDIIKQNMLGERVVIYRL